MLYNPRVVNPPRDQETTHPPRNAMNYITYNESFKTYAITSRQVGIAMISMGNPYNHNRGGVITDKTKAIASLKKAGYTLVGAHKWKTYPMGGAAVERMEIRGLVAYLDHAVEKPCGEQVKTLCGVRTSSLCMDDSLSSVDLPDCPKCRKIILANAQ